MPTAYVASASAFTRRASGYHLSPDLAAVIVFSLIGLVASAALITCLGSDASLFVLDAF